MIAAPATRAHRRTTGLLAVAVTAAGVAAAIASCGGGEKQSLVVLSLSTAAPEPAVTTVTVTIDDLSRTFPLTGLSATPYSVGIYTPARLVGRPLLISATARTTATSCLGFAGKKNATIPAAGATLAVELTLNAGDVCPRDGGTGGSSGTGGTKGGDGGVDGGGTGGAGGVGGGLGGAGGGAGGAGGGTGGTGGGAGGTGGGAGGTGGGTGGAGGGGTVVPLTCTEYTYKDGCTDDVGITDLSFSRDGRYLVAGGDDGSVAVWTWNGTILTPSGAPYEFPIRGLTYVSFSPNSVLITAGTEEGYATVFRMPAFTVAGVLQDLTGNVYGVAFGPDNTHIYTIDSSSTLSTFSMASLSTSPVAVQIMPPTTYTLASSVAHPNGTFDLVIGFNTGTASLLNVNNYVIGGAVPFTVGTGAASVWTADFSRDGNAVAAGTSDGAVGLWTVTPTGPSPLAARPTATVNFANDVVFSPSGADLAVAGGDGAPDLRVSVYSVATGALKATATPASRPLSVAYSPDGAIVFGEYRCGKLRVCR